MFNTTVMIPGQAFFEAHVLGVSFNLAVRRFMVAIAGQESNWSARVQSGNGPAHSFWQFEKGGGVTGVLNHFSGRAHILKICDALKVTPTPQAVWTEMAKLRGDNLSFAMARLLIFTDRAQVPDDDEGTWAYYLRNWRPGKPKPKAWARNMAEARRVVVS